MNPIDTNSQSIQAAYWLWGTFVLFIVADFLWCQFAAYPSAFESQLRRGKSWIYIPLGWKGFRKFFVLSLSRLLILSVAGSGTILAAHYLPPSYLMGRHGPFWIAGVAVFLFLAATRLDAFWNHLRYRQQEDAYYRLHDELSAKWQEEGKDYTEVQIRSLTAYQHQQSLHKADEAGKFLSALKSGAKRARQRPAPVSHTDA